MAERKYLGQDIHRMVSGDYKWRAFIADQWVQGRTLTELKDEMRRVCGKGKQPNGHTYASEEALQAYREDARRRFHDAKTTETI